MNPFENEEDQNININNLKIDEFSITTWIEKRGKKTNTYITGWNIDENDLKEYIKSFKKSKGCNGSLKVEDNNLVIQFQGDKLDEFIDFMKEKGVKENQISIKGQ